MFLTTASRAFRISIMAATVYTASMFTAAAEEVSVALDWVVGGVHAGYFVAKEKGFYSDAGLEVDISRGFGSGDTVKRVATGTATFGIADTGTIITAIANETVPVRIVAMVYDRATLGLIYLAESGITSPEDLKGRTIGRSASGAGVNMFPGFLKANSLDRGEINEVVTDATTFMPMLLSGKVDAIVEQSILISKFQRVAAEQGKTAVAMRYSDFGLTAYGNAVIVSETTLESNPDVIQPFVEASMQGIAYAFDHPDEAVAIMKKTNPEINTEATKGELLAFAEVQDTAAVHEHGLGYIDQKKMEATRDMVTNALSLKRTAPLDEIYTDEFLPDKITAGGN